MKIKVENHGARSVAVSGRAGIETIGPGRWRTIHLSRDLTESKLAALVAAGAKVTKMAEKKSEDDDLDIDTDGPEGEVKGEPIATATGVVSSTDAPKADLEDLKKQASELKLSFGPNIGAGTLQERIAEARQLAQTQPELTKKAD